MWHVVQAKLFVAFQVQLKYQILEVSHVTGSQTLITISNWDIKWYIVENIFYQFIFN